MILKRQLNISEVTRKGNYNDWWERYFSQIDETIENDNMVKACQECENRILADEREKC